MKLLTGFLIGFIVGYFFGAYNSTSHMYREISKNSIDGYHCSEVNHERTVREVIELRAARPVPQ